MKIVKTARIHKIIVTPPNVKALAQRIYDEYDRDLKQKGKDESYFQSLRFILISEDGTQYEDDDLSIFREDGVLFNRKIVSVEMRYSTGKDDKDIVLGLNHSKSESYFNEIKVSGSDENWVEGTFAKLQEILSNCRPQSTFFVDHSGLFTVLFVACFLFSAYAIMNFLFNFGSKYITFSSAKDSLEVKIWALVGVPLVCLVFFVSAAYSISNKIEKLYPNVELLLGPEHLQRESLRRRKLYGILSAIIIPTLVGLILKIIS